MTCSQMITNVEKSHLKIGYIPLIDCAALAIAKERGIFEKYGLDVELVAEPSWANIRDKVALGLLDGAHMLAGMPIAATVGAGPVKVPMVTAFSMSLNGNAITVSEALYEKLLGVEPDLADNYLLAGAALKTLVEQDRRAGRAPLVLAHVYNFSSHNYQLRYWLASVGIDPDTDVRLVVVPPVQMAQSLRLGSIDGYCVGEPWNTQAVEQGIGRILITGHNIWNNAPEKVFGVTKEWAEQHPQTHLALITALLEASVWLDKVGNRSEVARILSDGDYLPLPPDQLESVLNGVMLQSASSTAGQASVFHQYNANFPWVSHAQWFMTQMYRWGQISEAFDVAEKAAEVYLPELYRQAAAVLGLTAPESNAKVEGEMSVSGGSDSYSQLEYGADRFIDGRIFDPEQWFDYLKDSVIHHESFGSKTVQALQCCAAPK